MFHPGRHDATTEGICGLKHYWGEDRNSLEAGSRVIQYFLDKHNYNYFKAFKDFKGAKSNLSSTHKLLWLRKQMQLKGY